MEASLFVAIVIIGLLIWLIGHSFIDSVYEHKGEMVDRMNELLNSEESE